MPGQTTPNHTPHQLKPSPPSPKTRSPPPPAHAMHPASPPPPPHLQTSRHNPDFRARNQLKILQIGTALSKLQLHLHRAKQTENQAALDDVHARAMRVGKGLESLAEGKLELMKPPGYEEEEGVGEMLRIDRPGDWYCVKHGRAEEEGMEYEEICAERVGVARRGYEEGLREGKFGEGVMVERAEEVDMGCVVETENKTQDASQDTTLVEDGDERKSLGLGVSEDVERLSVRGDLDAGGAELAMFLE